MFTCTFCSDEFLKQKVRRRSINSVVDELQNKFETYGTDVSNIVDADFTLSKKMVNEFCAAIRNKNLHKKMTFSAQSDTFRPLSRNMLQEMKDTSFTYLAIGVERIDSSSKKMICKDFNEKILLRNLSMMKDYGFVVGVNYLIGFPFESIELLQKENKNFTKIHKEFSDLTSTAILQPMPGTVEFEKMPQKNKKWYLNFSLYNEYKPFYQGIIGLSYDPYENNMFDFNNKLIKELINTKILFRRLALRRKGMLYSLAFKIGIVITSFSMMLYHISPKLEKMLFKQIIKFTENQRQSFTRSISKWKK